MISTRSFRRTLTNTSDVHLPHGHRAHRATSQRPTVFTACIVLETTVRTDISPYRALRPPRLFALWFSAVVLYLCSRVLFHLSLSSVRPRTSRNIDPPMTAMPELHTIPISSRPRRTWAQTAHGILFVVVFLFACLMINASQLVVILPLRLFPFRRARKLYYEGVRYTKGAFGALLGAFLHCLNAAEGRGI